MESGRVDEALAVQSRVQQQALVGEARGGHLAVARTLAENNLLLLRLRELCLLRAAVEEMPPGAARDVAQQLATPDWNGTVDELVTTARAVADG